MNLFFTSKAILVFNLMLAVTVCRAQQDTIIFALNGRASNAVMEGQEPVNNENPFVKFIGEWTLKNDTWVQNWGAGTDTIKIVGHHTVSKVLNTDNSLLSIIDGPEPNGHIFWTYNPVNKKVYHSSSFGASRIGQGEGRINAAGDLSLKVAFEGEPAGTYRRYAYEWVSEDEYVMKSVQFDERDEPTGLHYGGRFQRLGGNDLVKSKIRQEILDHGEKIRLAFSESDVATIESLHHPEVTKALGYGDVKNNREEVMEGIQATLKSYALDFVENDVESILVLGDTAVEQTKFSIKGTPINGGEPFLFSGRTMVTYVKYAKSPTGWATVREIIQLSN